MIESALYSLLSNDQSIMALVGDRIYPLIAPEHGPTPFITFAKISGARFHTLGVERGPAEPRFQIDIYDLSYISVKTVADAVRHALDTFSGTVGGVKIMSALLENERDFHEGTVQPPLERVSLDFMIMHQEA